MEELRLIKIEKYMEIVVSQDIIKDKIILDGFLVCRIDFTRYANIFYGYDTLDDKWKQIQLDDFSNYNVVSRLTNWNKNNDKENYYFRILKSNQNETVDFNEEQEYLKCKIM